MSEQNGAPPARTAEALGASAYLGEYHDPRHARAAIWTCVAAIGAFFAWAALTPVYETIDGEGTVRPEGLSQRVEHLDGGIVADAFVAEGDVVDAGDPLLALDTGDLEAESRKLAARIARLDRTIARYDALLELDLSDPGIMLPAQLMLDADPALVEELAYRRAQLAVLGDERDVTRAELATLDDRERNLAAELEIVTEQRRRYAEAGTNMVVPLRQIEELDREIIRLESAIDGLAGDRAIARARLRQMRSQTAELVGSYRRDAAQSRLEAVEERAAARETAAQLDERTARSVLRAPVAGVVHGLTIQGKGEVLASGEVVMEIVPQGAVSFAEIEIPAERIGGVEIGDAASVKVLTYDFTRFGEIEARVERISPSSFLGEDGRATFRVALGFETQKLGLAGAAPAELKPILPGMTVMASIRSDRRSILAYLLKPLRVISDRALTEA
jgi:HlyD family type I secretion membrane fusion protein